MYESPTVKNRPRFWESCSISCEGKYIIGNLYPHEPVRLALAPWILLNISRAEKLYTETLYEDVPKIEKDKCFLGWKVLIFLNDDEKDTF